MYRIILLSALFFFTLVSNTISANNHGILRKGNVFHVLGEVDLEGKDWVLPNDCTIQFDGGQINNGCLYGCNTLLKGDVSLNCLVKGYFANDYFFVSWLKSSDSFHLALMIESIFNLDHSTILFLDKDIRLDGARYDVKRVLILTLLVIESKEILK